MSLTPRDITTPKEYERIAEKRTGLASRGGILVETVHVTKDGLKIPVESNIRQFQYLGRQVALSISRDITDRKQAEKTLQEQLQFLQQLLDAIPIPIFYKDRQGLYRGCNMAYEKFLGMTKERIIGKTVFEVVPQDLANIYYRADEALFTQPGTQVYETSFLHVNGKKHNIIFHKATYAGTDGCVAGLLGAIVDITDRKQAEEKLLDTLESLRKAVGVTIQVMVSAIEKRDPYTAGHQARSANLARAIATEMGLSSDKVDGIRIAASIHDIGNLSIPAEILSKPTKLSEIEFSLIKEHARQGFEILEGVESPWPLAEMVYQHHERMDGSGYPRHLKGDDILPESRILAVADVVAAISAHRPYRPALGTDAAMEEISKNRGVLYDPEATDACLRLFKEKGYRLN